MRPKLESEFKELSAFLLFSPQFLTDCGPNYGKKVELRPSDQLGLDAPGFNYNKFSKQFSFKNCEEIIFKEWPKNEHLTHSENSDRQKTIIGRKNSQINFEDI